MVPASTEDPFDLERFVSAQDSGGTYEEALAELRHGRKRTHWMWFVFPQIAGLGTSPASRHYAIGSVEEARAYLAHGVLGPRLRECAAALAAHTSRSAEEILGALDAKKLHSSATLFHRAAPGEAIFLDLIDRYFAGILDEMTDRLTGGSPIDGASLLPGK